MSEKPAAKDNKIYRCKKCKVQVVSPTCLKPILGKQHGKHCPRRFK